MLCNYLAAALRNLMRNRLYAVLNILGLAVGFAAAILIGLYVRDELTFDRWLPDHERTYLLTVEMVNEGHQPIYSDLVPSELVTALEQEFPEVEHAARMMWGGASMRHGNIEEFEQLFTVDPAFVDIVKLPVVAGNLHEALRRPDGLVLTRRMAHKYFGRDDPVGETIELDRQHTVTVAAVVEDLPSNSTVSFGGLVSGLASYSTLARRDADPGASEAGNFFGDSETYVRLKSGASAERVNAGLAAFLQRHKGPALAAGLRATLDLIPITDVHLSRGTRGFHLDILPRADVATIDGILAVGVLIILVACINFINLMTARSVRRAVEVGVRKTSGAFRRDLILQFLGEALIYAGSAMMVAMAVVSFVLPSFNALLDKTLAFAFWRDGHWRRCSRV